MQAKRTLVVGVLAALAGMSGARVGLGQVIPKIPPAPTPTPEYVPPPTPAAQPAPVTPPPEPEPQVSLIERDSTGKLKMISGSVEEAAIRAYPFDAERKAKIAASLAAREGEIERFAVDHLADVKAALKAREGIEQVKDFAALNVAREAAKPLKQENVLDRLQREGAIGGPQRARLDQMVTEYIEARKKEQSEQTGSDVMKIATIVGQQGFNDLTRDALGAFDRLSDRALNALRSGQHGLTLDAAQADARKRLLEPGGADSGRDGLRTFLLDTLTPEQGKDLLGRLAPATNK